MNQYSHPRLPMRLAPKRCERRGVNLVRISDDARDCSVFLGFSSGDDFILGGTGFFVGYPGGADRSLFLITAAHVAKKLNGTPFAIRMSADNGEAKVHDIEQAKWIFHTNKNVDIAILPFDCPDWAKKTIKSIPTNEFLNDARVDHFDIGAGDLVQIVGLFRLKPLKQKNLPIVHTGHIALFPSDETLPVGRGPDTIHVNGYMVEISGLEGSSGSPAYMRPTVVFNSDARELPNTTAKTLTTAHARLYLLGVWIGAWSGPPDDTLSKESGLSRNIMVPVGMGIVIPASRIMEILESEEIQTMRKEAIQKKDDAYSLKPLALPDALPSSDENPTHLEDFNHLLGAASQKPKPIG